MNSDIVGIKYVKVVRDCPYNTKLIEQGTEGRLIHDYAVYQNGKHIATFNREVGSIRYRLLDADDKQIRIPETIRVYIAMSRKDMDRILKAALEADAIPSEEFIAKRKVQEAERQAQIDEQNRLEAIEARKMDRAEDMYTLLQDIFESVLLPVEYVSRLNTIVAHVKEEVE